MTKYLFILVAFLCACSGTQPKSENATAAGTEAEKLNHVISNYAEKMKHLDAYAATYFNVEEDLSKFGDYPSDDQYNRGKAIFQTAIDELAAVHSEKLAPKDLRTYLLFKEDMEVNLAGYEFPDRYLEVNQMGSRLHDYMDSSSKDLTSFPFDSLTHYQAYLKRSEGFPSYIDRQIALLRDGIKKNVTLSCIVAKKVPETYSEALQLTVEKNPFYRPVTFLPSTISGSDADHLKTEFASMVKDRIIPGYRKFDKFFRQEYLPHCRSGFGLASFKNGVAWYRQAIRSSTNLSLEAKDIHQTGLKEVARIRGEIEKIKTQLGYKGSYKSFLTSLRKDPKSYFQSSDAMFKKFLAIKDDIKSKLPKYFSLIPKTDYNIVESSNPEDAAGQYNGPTEMMTIGRFIVNTKNLRSVPIYVATTLSLHETIPGHHMQIALQYEMKDELSEYQRKMYGSNSFSEGWALYSEYLGNEMGMYSDPIQRLGNLNDEMLRAVRLVVDTGIHSMGWSQKKAIAYAMENIADDRKQIEIEINRYSVWPGQALGYKIGQLKIIELRQKAEKALGDKFDIKGFHKAVIGNGTVSMTVMQMQVDDWIKSRL